MTTVCLYRKHNHYLGFEFSEHATYDEDWGKLVCAALSITSISAVNAIDLLTDAVPTVEVDEEAGYLKCMLVEEDLPRETWEKTDLIIGHLSIAVSGLVEEYPDYVKLYTKEVDEHA